jgi:hypothetical protein
VQHKIWDEHGRERNEVKENSQVEPKSEKSNEIETCVCV